jgi:hypothetical protein
MQARDTKGLFARCGIDAADQICGPDTPALDPSRMISSWASYRRIG